MNPAQNASPCECCHVNKHVRDICDGTRAGLSLEQVNHRRRLWNVAPLDALPVKDAPVQRPLSTGERIVSFLGITAQTVWRAIKMEPWLLTEEEMQPRLDICNACVQLVDGHCNLCGCNCQAENGVKFMSKLSHKDASCPMDSPKWGPLP